MIHKVTNVVAFRANINELNDNNENFKKNYLKRHYNDLYKRDVKTNNSVISVFGISSILCFIGSVVSKNPEYKFNIRTTSLGCGAGAIVAYLFRPQKEKYDAQVQIDLNKETANKN